MLQIHLVGILCSPSPSVSDSRSSSSSGSTVNDFCCPGRFEVDCWGFTWDSLVDPFLAEVAGVFVGDSLVGGTVV